MGSLRTLFALVIVVSAASCGSSDAPDSGAIAADAGNVDDPGPGVDAEADADANASDGGPCRAAETTTTVEDRADGRLVIAGDVGSAATADPSIAYPPGAIGGAMAYSSVPSTIPGGDQAGLHTRVAVSSDHGATWTYVTDVNVATPIAVPAGTCPATKTCTAAVVNETPSIVYDPSDPLEARHWKIFTHRYVVLRVMGDPEAKLLYPIGHIAMFTANDPVGPWAGPTNIAGWPNSGGFDTGAAYLTTSRSETATCGALGEPGATVAPDGTLHLAVSCIAPPFSDPTLDIVLLGSPSGRGSIGYVSTPIRGADGACSGGGGKRMNAVDLFVAGGTEYLMATPEKDNERAGCIVVPFRDSTAGTLDRDGQGRVRVIRRFEPRFGTRELARYMGACTYAEGASATGTTMSHLLIEPAALPTLHEITTGIAAAP